jgi:hypothetical protein
MMRTWQIAAALATVLGAWPATGKAVELAVGAVRKNADPVEKYGKLELVVPISGLRFENPYDPDQVDLVAEFTAPSGRKWRVPGFYAPKKSRDYRDPDGWRVRFAANEEGLWKGVVLVKNKDREARSPAFGFTCARSSRHGWIRASKADPHYFVHDDGTTWYGVGHCDHVNLGNDIPLEDMSKNGLNVLVHWVFSDHPIESEGRESENTGLGLYDQTNCRWIDELVERCEKLDIKLIWIVWFHSQFYNRYNVGWSKGRLRNNPYHNLRRGKLPANEWASDPESLACQDKFHRYLIARWGHSPAVGMWDLLCEINLARQKSVETWLKRTHDLFRKTDVYGHPTSVGGSGEQWLPRCYQIVDSPNFHSYREQPVERWVAHLVGRTRAMRAFGKPCYIGECGTSDPAKRLAFMHRANWACTAAGAALTPLYWTHGDRYYKDHAGMSADTYLRHQGILAKFVKDIPFGTRKLSPIPAKDLALSEAAAKAPEPEATSETPFDFEIVAGKKWGVKHAAPPLVLAGPKKGPGAPEVNVHVMGATHSEMKSPLVFGVKCGEGAKLRFHVEATSKAGSHLVVRTGKLKFFDHDFPFDAKRKTDKWTSTVDREFSVDLPPGVHALTVENRGRDWVRIDRYRFKNLLAPTARDIALMKNRSARGTTGEPVLGMRGEGVAFLYLLAPPATPGTRLSLANMGNGTYSVEWWNTWTGEIVAREEVASVGGKLQVAVPGSVRDLACKIRKKE